MASIKVKKQIHEIEAVRWLGVTWYHTVLGWNSHDNGFAFNSYFLHKSERNREK